MDLADRILQVRISVAIKAIACATGLPLLSVTIAAAPMALEVRHEYPPALEMTATQTRIGGQTAHMGWELLDQLELLCVRYYNCYYMAPTGNDALNEKVATFLTRYRAVGVPVGVSAELMTQLRTTASAALKNVTDNPGQVRAEYESDLIAALTAISSVTQP